MPYTKRKMLKQNSFLKKSEALIYIYRKTACAFLKQSQIIVRYQQIE